MYYVYEFAEVNKLKANSNQMNHFDILKESNWVVWTDGEGIY